MLRLPTASAPSTETLSVLLSEAPPLLEKDATMEQATEDLIDALAAAGYDRDLVADMVRAVPPEFHAEWLIRFLTAQAERDSRT